MNRRLGAIGISFIFFTAVVLIRLFYWQIIRGGELSRVAQLQYQTNQNLSAPRGEIRSSDGFPLVTNQTTYSLVADPSKIIDATSFTKKLISILSENLSPKEAQELKNKISESIVDRNLHWVILARDLPADAVTKIEKLSLTGLEIATGSIREYPESSMAASLLGIVASDKDGNPTGYFGLEGHYNRELIGRNGVIKSERDAQGNPILTGNFDLKEAEKGKNLVLYIDRGAQFIAERELSKGLTLYGASEGTVTIIDAKTGGILAMASLPPVPHNPVISKSFEPGSIFKPLVMAMAINEKALSPETLCDRCAGPWQVGDYSIHTWNDKYFPNETMTEVIEHSDNVGMTFVADKIDHKTFLKYLREFGFGQLTSIDLQDEDSLSLRDGKEWYPIDYATASFGQGIAVTPIQLLRAMATIANDGILVEPHVVEKVVSDSQEVQIKPKIINQVISSETAQAVTKMMVNAVDRGEAKWTSLKGFKIAGKTGTAQIPVGGKYEKEKTNASFVGFAPADNPKFVMLVTLHNPTTSPWAAETAAPLWFTIARDLFMYWGITNFR